MRQPFSIRRGIPFYHAKTEAEFKEDVYERYDELVTRQTALHLGDDLHGGYPFQQLLDYLLGWLPTSEEATITDVGCSVGRLAAEVAARHPSWTVHGVDLSYQMLRQANDFWVKGLRVWPNLLRYGFGSPTLQAAEPLTGKRAQLDFLLAKADDLPFEDQSQDIVVNTFLLDRVPKPFATLNEFRRVLKPGGRLVTVTPLNFISADGWRNAHPPVKILDRLRTEGWQVLDWTDPMILYEPMDARGNAITWRCLAFVAERES